ncbi:MAG: LysR family transcriptional regulator [Proteobacteria bacterium]|nr:LysR family transcriptional regulator [Pseudomonadota bacterium]MCP4916297.1 LysR family transcriptional regulator [Pseudomonadota bacterium]
MQELPVDWDDIRILTVVARAGSLTEGARVLRVNPMTVTRRLRALEEAAGTSLTEKWKHGIVLTPAGEDMAGVGGSVEGLMHDLDARIVMRVATIATFMDALQAGVGLALLPCITGERLPGVRRVGAWSDGGTWLWVLTHPDLRSSARVQAFTRFVRGVIDRDRALLEGGLV